MQVSEEKISFSRIIEDQHSFPIFRVNLFEPKVGIFHPLNPWESQHLLNLGAYIEPCALIIEDSDLYHGWDLLDERLKIYPKIFKRGIWVRNLLFLFFKWILDSLHRFPHYPPSHLKHYWSTSTAILST